MVRRLSAFVVITWRHLAGGFIFACCFSVVVTGNAATRPPNIVLIYMDDMGWGDVGANGATKIRTPNFDRLAREGTRFTSFYVSQAVCSASRASLLTGCYANRLGIHGALGPGAKIGLNTNETTIAGLLKRRGYATSIVGKWHLGRPAEVLPLRYGFDEYFGLPYSNDMWPHHPTAQPGAYPPLPLIDGDQVIEEMPDQHRLTRRYTERAVGFIERNRDRPFFLYLAHSMPHVPLFVSEPFSGKSAAGIYGDVIEELDASIGDVLAALERSRTAENTWVIVTSDNGPWLSYGNHAGSSGPFREGKGTAFEGGIRVPCVMRWPKNIPAGKVCDEPLMTIDLLPTIGTRVGAALPTRRIDGRDVWPVLSGEPDAISTRSAYWFYYGENELRAIRSGRWKLMLPQTAAVLEGQPGGRDGKPVPYRSVKIGLALYDLKNDPGESRNVAAENPEVMMQLLEQTEAARTELGDSLTQRTGVGLREPSQVGQ